jgi:hypothetical protein
LNDGNLTIKELLMEHTDLIVAQLLAVVMTPDHPAFGKCLELTLAYRFGRPTQAVQLTADVAVTHVSRSVVRAPSALPAPSPPQSETIEPHATVQ